jgi:hypothetical protein
MKTKFQSPDRNNLLPSKHETRVSQQASVAGQAGRGVRFHPPVSAGWPLLPVPAAILRQLTPAFTHSKRETNTHSSAKAASYK